MCTFSAVADGVRALRTEAGDAFLDADVHGVTCHVIAGPQITRHIDARGVSSTNRPVRETLRKQRRSTLIS